MKSKTNTNLVFLLTTTIASIIFFVSAAWDVTPYLRGPAPYPPEWRWPYLFINTYSRALVPIFILTISLYLFYFLEYKGDKFIERHKILINIILIKIQVLFTLSIIYFSRAGLGVLFHRIANPGLNGYFTTATKITNLSTFLANYHHNIFDYYMHARAHPPGGVLLHYVINQIASHLYFLYPLLNSFTPKRDDILELWNSLRQYEQLGALSSSIIIIFLSACTLPFIFITTRKLYGTIAGLRSAFLFAFIPSVILFAPLIDVLFPLFAASSFYFLYRGLTDNKVIDYFFSAFIMSIGILFGLNMLPVLGMFILYLFLEKAYSKLRFAQLSSYIVGFLCIPLFLILVFKFNYPEVIRKNIAEGIAPRAYWIWLIYNFYDFFIFAGIPVIISFISLLKYHVQKRTQFKTITTAFIFTLLLLDVLGVSRGEVARLWLPFIPFLVIIISGHLTRDLKVPTKYFLLILFFQALQVLILQEYWVPLW